MAERHRSKDGLRETDAFTDREKTRGQSGWSQGREERDVGTLDEEKQVMKGGGAMRVTKKDEEGEGNLGGHHGAGGGKS